MDQRYRQSGAGARGAAPAFGVHDGSLMMFGRRLPLPRERRWRVTLGIALILGGFLGFLPILGFWMVPLGLLVLSADIAIVRRVRRRSAVRWGRWRSGPRSGSCPATNSAAAIVNEVAVRNVRD